MYVRGLHLIASSRSLPIIPHLFLAFPGFLFVVVEPVSLPACFATYLGTAHTLWALSGNPECHHLVKSYLVLILGSNWTATISYGHILFRYQCHMEVSTIVGITYHFPNS